MAECTPGPWELTRDNLSIQAYPPGLVVRICLCPGYGFGYTESHNWAANARLVAAAPDLLAACECEEVMRLDDGSIVAIHAVQDRVLTRHGWDGSENQRDFVDRLRTAAVAKATGQS